MNKKFLDLGYQPLANKYLKTYKKLSLKKDELFKLSVNFNTKSRMVSWMTGGLNTQIEHHLFPNICSIHYRKLGPIVKQTAAEFGVAYREYPTWPKTIASHYRLLRSLGRQIT